MQHFAEPGQHRPIGFIDAFEKKRAARSLRKKACRAARNAARDLAGKKIVRRAHRHAGQIDFHKGARGARTVFMYGACGKFPAAAFLTPEVKR